MSSGVWLLLIIIGACWCLVENEPIKNREIREWMKK